MPDNLTPADRFDVLFALSYGIRFNSSGKARGKIREAEAIALAEQQYAHLQRAGYVVMKRPGIAPHSTPPSGRPCLP